MFWVLKRIVSLRLIKTILLLLRKLNPHKDSVPDLIPARILKVMAVEISPLLTIIFQRSFDCGKVPDDWR